ncbi:MAG: DUF1540 domain-containing protein [Defluviitaleaceae bacterium]|nr:DUF1540 domain-containing protein [Defluviitaleaceae bacterium]
MINCSVMRCRHNDQQNHCSLNSINVGCCTPTPHECSDTECNSFEETI